MGNGERIGGTALIAAAAGTVMAMGHHPTELEAGGVAGIVHMAMLVFLGLTAFGFASFAVARGVTRPVILAGMICYAIALFGHTGAATINGFVVPALAGRGASVGRDTFLLAWDTNQVLAKLGVIAAGGAILFWSADFLARSGAEPCAIGILGVAAGAAPAALLATGAIDMNLTGAFIAYAAHAAWGTAVGVHLLRRKASAAPS